MNLSHQYDALGQLIQKKVGGLASGTPLQKVNYRYNIRGWLTQINDVNQFNPDPLATDGDLFAFKIAYQNPSLAESDALFNLSRLAEVANFVTDYFRLR
jgi:hypothetical protein